MILYVRHEGGISTFILFSSSFSLSLLICLVYISMNSLCMHTSYKRNLQLNLNRLSISHLKNPLKKTLAEYISIRLLSGNRSRGRKRRRKNKKFIQLKPKAVCAFVKYFPLLFLNFMLTFLEQTTTVPFIKVFFCKYFISYRPKYIYDI